MTYKNTDESAATSIDRRITLNRRRMLKGIAAAGAGITFGTGSIGSAAAAPSGGSPIEKCVFTQDGELRTIADGEGTATLPVTNVAAIGSSVTDLDDDGKNDIAFLENSEEIQLINENKSTARTMDITGKPALTRNTHLTTGQWNDSRSVFYVAATGNGGDICRVTPDIAPTRIASPENGVNAVSGIADIDGDGKNELAFVDGSQQLRYVEASDDLTQTFAKIPNASVGTNNSVGPPAYFNGKSTARIPFVDGSNQLHLADADGIHTTLVGGNDAEQVTNSPICPADADGDGELEVVYIENNNSPAELKYIDDVGGANEPTPFLNENNERVRADTARGVTRSITKFRLDGTAEVITEPGTDPVNQVVSIETNDSGEHGSLFWGLDSTELPDLDGLLSLDAKIVSGDTGAGNPRIIISVDTDGDGEHDGWLFGHHKALTPSPSGPPGIAGEGWVRDLDFTGSESYWRTPVIGGPTGNAYYDSWSETKELWNDSNYELLEAAVVDSGWWNNKLAGELYLDNIQIGDNFWEGPEDSVSAMIVEESDSSGDGRLDRVSTRTAESTGLGFTLENGGDSPVSVTGFALDTDVRVDSIKRSGDEVTLEGDQIGRADSPDGFSIDDQLTSLDNDASYDAGTSGQADFGLYDFGDVALTLDPVTDKPSSSYLSATLEYGDDTTETFQFKITNFNS